MVALPHTLFVHSRLFRSPAVAGGEALFEKYGAVGGRISLTRPSPSTRAPDPLPLITIRSPIRFSRIVALPVQSLMSNAGVVWFMLDGQSRPSTGYRTLSTSTQEGGRRGALIPEIAREQRTATAYFIKQILPADAPE